MTTTLAIKKGSGLQDIIANYKTAIPEEPASLIVSPGRKNFDTILTLCEKAHKMYYHSNHYIDRWDNNLFTREVMPVLRENILSPSEINALVSLVLSLGVGPNEWKDFSKSFLRNIIQFSYDTGGTQFTFTIPKWNFYLDRIGQGVRGRKDRPLQLQVEGDVGENFCNGALYVHAQVQGNVGGRCGLASRCSHISVEGNAGNSFGGHAHYSEFFLAGNCGPRWANLGHGSMYVFQGNDISTEGAYRSHGCTFKAASLEVLRVLNRNIGIHDRYINRQNLMYIHADGTEEVI